MSPPPSSTPHPFAFPQLSASADYTLNGIVEVKWRKCSNRTNCLSIVWFYCRLSLGGLRFDRPAILSGAHFVWSPLSCALYLFTAQLRNIIKAIKYLTVAAWPFCAGCNVKRAFLYWTHYIIIWCTTALMCTISCRYYKINNFQFVMTRHSFLYKYSAKNCCSIMGWGAMK